MRLWTDGQFLPSFLSLLLFYQKIVTYLKIRVWEGDGEEEEKKEGEK